MKSFKKDYQVFLRFIYLQVCLGRDPHLPIQAEFGPKFDAFGLHQCCKRGFVVFDPKGWQVKPVERKLKEKSFASIPMQNLCFKLETLYIQRLAKFLNY